MPVFFLFLWQQLIDTKGATSSTTLLHFLVDIVEQNFPIISDFLEELEDCGKAYKGTVRKDI
jgi:hypothetical protein